MNHEQTQAQMLADLQHASTNVLRHLRSGKISRPQAVEAIRSLGDDYSPLLNPELKIHFVNWLRLTDMELTSELGWSVKRSKDTKDTGVQDSLDKARFPRLSQLIDAALQAGASDFHVGHGEYPVFRVLKSMIRVESLENLPLTLSSKGFEEVVMELINALGLPRHFNRREAFNWDDRLRLRVCRYRALGRERLAFRIQTREAPYFSQLELEPQVAQELTSVEPGLVLISGGASAGKTSTMASALTAMLTEKMVHVRTLEAPVEYILPTGVGLVSQQHVGVDTEGWAQGVEETLSHDVNVLAVGEILERETAAAAIRAANLNIRVLATINAPSVPMTITRILQEFNESDRSEVLAALRRCLRMIVCVNLTPTGDGKVLLFNALKFDGKTTKYLRNLEEVASLDGLLQRKEQWPNNAFVKGPVL